MTTTFLNLPPHLLPSSTPPLSGTPSGQNTSTPPHVHTSTPPHLHRSLVPPVDKIPPHLLTSTALWYPQWTKYLLPSSTPPLSGAPSGPHPAFWRPKWCSLAPQVSPQVSLSGASRGNLHCSLAPLAKNDVKIPFIYYLYIIQ